MTDVPIITINKASPPFPLPGPSTFASQSSFTQKLLNFTFILADTPGGLQPTSFAGQQGIGGGGGTLNVTGARARCRINAGATPGYPTANIAIYGLSQSIMSQLATLGIAFNSVTKNSILVSAGAASLPLASAANATLSPLSGFPVVFAGTVWFAYVDYNSMPEVSLRIQARTGLSGSIISTAPTSYQGSTSIESIMQKFADALGVPLENNGVSGSLSNPYFGGTLMQQIFQAADHAGIRAELVDGATKLAIMPLAGSRTSLTNVPLISKNTGMIKAPSFAGNGFLAVEFVYNQDVALFGNIQIASDNVPQANGPYTVCSLDHSLDTLVPRGDWKTTALCYPRGLSPPPPPTVQIG
jgi:hypothetical protein